MGLLTRSRVRVGVERLESVLSRLPVRLPGVAVLGVGMDGIPLLVDVHDRRVGSLLVVADDLAVGQGLLDVIRRSLTRLSYAHEVQVWWGTERERQRSVGMTRVFALHDRGLENALLHLADVVESRQHGKLPGPTQVLLLDDLSIVRAIDREGRWALEYLLRAGAEQRVWVAAAVGGRDAEARCWYRRFGRLVTWNEAGHFECGKERFYPVEV